MKKLLLALVALGSSLSFAATKKELTVEHFLKRGYENIAQAVKEQGAVLSYITQNDSKLITIEFPQPDEPVFKYKQCEYAYIVVEGEVTKETWKCSSYRTSFVTNSLN